MAAASPWIHALCISLGQHQPTSAPVNPQITRLCFHPIIPTALTFSSVATTSNSARRWPKEVRTVYSTAGNVVLKGNNEDESLRENAKYPRPQEVSWQKELANKVYFTGVISQPVQFKHTKSGKAFACTEITVGTSQLEGTMWFPLIFFDELAESAALHLKLNDEVRVSGRFTLWRTDGEDDKPYVYKVIANTLNFTQNTSLDFSEQHVVEKNTPSPALSRQAVIYGDTFQYQKFPVQSSSSGKNAEEVAANIERLWQTFFTNPFDWWDNRTNKRNPRAPDFKHKDSGEGLWIESRHSPSWLKSQLDILDSRLGKWRESGSSTRSRGSLSSFKINDF